MIMTFLGRPLRCCSLRPEPDVISEEVESAVAAIAVCFKKSLRLMPYSSWSVNFLGRASLEPHYLNSSSNAANTDLFIGFSTAEDGASSLFFLDARTFKASSHFRIAKDNKCPNSNRNSRDATDGGQRNKGKYGCQQRDRVSSRFEHLNSTIDDHRRS